MKRFLFFSYLMLAVSSFAHCQIFNDFFIGKALSVGRGGRYVESQYVMLELGDSSAKKAIILPRVPHRDSIAEPEFGMMLYDKSDNTIYFYNRTSWMKVGEGSSAQINLSVDHTSNKVTVLNNGGDPAIINPVNSSTAGVMTPAMLDSLYAKISSVTTQYSIIGTGKPGSPARLAGDASSPGIKKYYGTDSNGIKGFHPVPVAQLPFVDGSITGNGIVPFKLSGDQVSPGTSKYYGTNNGGTKGFWELPLFGSGSGTITDITAAGLDASSGLSTTGYYNITDLGKHGLFIYKGMAADQSTDNGGTRIITADNKIFERIYAGGVYVGWFGGVADGVNSASPGNDDALAFRNAIAAAKPGEKIYGEGIYYLASTVFLNGSVPKYLEIRGTVYVAVGITGFQIEGLRHTLAGDPIILGLNSGATDSASFSLYTGTGIYLKNADKAKVYVTRVANFHTGIKLAGESTTIEAGAQYNKVWAQQVSHCYNMILLTSIGTPADPAKYNWCNSNEFFLGQIGSGLYANLGGVYGIRIIKDPTSNAFGPFDQNVFNNPGFEGCIYGWWAQFAHNTIIDKARYETLATTNKMYWEDTNTAGLGCFNNEIHGTTVYKSYFLKAGINTTVYGTFLSPSGSRIGSLSTYTNGKWTHFINNDPVTGLAETDDNIISYDNLDGNYPDRYLMSAKINGKTRFVPFENSDTLTTAATFAVPNGYDMVYVNRSAGTAKITFPNPASWKRREISVRNIDSGQNVVINNSVLPLDEDSIIGPKHTYRYKSNGTAWNLISKTAASVSAGAGTGDVTSNTTTSVNGELVTFNGITGKQLKRFTGTGFVKATNGVASVQTGISVADINATGRTASTVLYGDGTWKVPPTGSGTGTSQWSDIPGGISYGSNVGIGISPGTFYSWLHIAASSTTKGIIEFAAINQYQTDPRLNSLDFNNINLRLTLADGSHYLLTDKNYLAIFNKIWRGDPIDLEYISIAGSAAKDQMVSDGVIAKWQTPRYSLEYSSSSAVGIAGLTETSMIGGSKALKGNLASGDKVEVHGFGTIDGGNVVTFRFTIGGVVVTLTPANNAAGTQKPFKYFLRYTPATIGTSGTGTIIAYVEITGDGEAHYDETNVAGLNSVAPSFNATLDFVSGANFVASSLDYSIETKRK